MPRTRPDGTTEHRITLGSYEREMVSDLIESAERDQTIETLLRTTEMLALPVAIGTAGFFVYRGMNGWGTGRDKIAEWFNDLGNNERTGPFRGGLSLLGDAILGLADLANKVVRGGGDTS